VKLESGGRVREVRLEREAARLDGETVPFRIAEEGAGGEILEVAGRRHRVRTGRQGNRAFVWCDGEAFEFDRARPAERRGPERGDLLAPMPGRVRRVFVEEGQSVARGDLLLLLEAMKMEHGIRSPRDGAVRRILHREGELVEAGAALVEVG
jgi:3-methylcrotonyl-CoA carboxylase alpha subunit